MNKTNSYIVVQFTGKAQLNIMTEAHKELLTYFDHFQDRITLAHP